MTTHYLADMTWEQVLDLPPAEAVALLPVGAMEAHGPHLPLATDVIIAQAMADAAARELSARGRPAVVLPPITYTAAPFAEGFPGTLSLTPEVVTDQIVGLAASLAGHGFSCLALANAHFDPAHLGALAEAAQRVRDAGRPRLVYPDVTRKPWATRLTEEFRGGACHAGRYETSVVMATRPELVREAVRAGLADVPISLADAIRAGQGTFEEAGGLRAYFGYPREASTAEGRATVTTLGSILVEAIEHDVS